jgi:hypothetical protein
LKQIILISLLITGSLYGHAQQPDSIYFNLYTDSLKKGTHNYINVDGKYANGSYRPLDAKSIRFTSSYGSFEGNSLVLPMDCKEEKVTITATVKSKPELSKTITLYIKKKPDDEKLKTAEELIRDLENKNRTKTDSAKGSRKRKRN